MPEFRLRSWEQQVLYDCEDYLVTADTIELAAAKLQEAQRYAQLEGTTLFKIEDITLLIGGGVRSPGEVLPLNPREVTDGDAGIAEINADGAKLRDVDLPPLEFSEQDEV